MLRMLAIRGGLGKIFGSIRYRPHEILLFLASSILGASWIAAVAPPQSVARAQPDWALHVWAACMLFSGIVGLVSLVLPKETERVLRLELGALLLGSATMVIYTTSLVTVAGAMALGPLITFGLWATANLFRAAQILWQIRRWNKL